VHGHVNRIRKFSLKTRMLIGKQSKNRKWKEPHPYQGKRLPAWRRRILSVCHMGLKQSEETKEKRRRAALRKLDAVYQVTKGYFPMRGVKEILFFNAFKSALNIRIVEQWRVAGYLVDAYIPQLNVVVEFDETGSHTFPYQQKQDLLRQTRISKLLGCEFLRVKEANWNVNPVKTLCQVRQSLEHFNHGALDEFER